MNLDHIPEGLLKKLRGLLKAEESWKSSGTEEDLIQAANASAKIRAILLKHNLDMQSVKASDTQATEDQKINHQTFDPETLTKPHEGKWVRELSKVIARYNMCELLFINPKSDSFYLIGTGTNIQVVWYIIDQLSNRLRLMAKAAFKVYDGKEKRNTFIRGYYLGAVKGIQVQLAENAAREKYNATQATQSMLNQIQPTEDQSMALSIASMQVTIMRKNTDYMHSTFSVGSSKSSAPKSKSIGGRAQGYEAGKSININGGLGAGSSRPTSAPKLLN
jgi:hypothetical protein